MQRVAVINIVGLTPGLLGPHTPRLTAFLARHGHRVVRPAFPAVTCTAQADYVTGRPPGEHGIVANGWYHRELAEVQFWKQPDAQVRGPKLWEVLKDANPDFTCAKLFWWYNMYSRVNWSVTPRPMYPADGRKVFDIYSWPYSLGAELKRDLGAFPFFGFWGPAAGVKSPQGGPDVTSRWIADCARWVEERHRPTLNLVYLPHLDYNLQRLGPGHPEIARDLGRIDALAGDLIEFLESRQVRVVVLSEYGITPVNRAVHLNRLFRKHGWLVLKEELGRELIDYGASRAFAVADHQVAHVYLQDPGLAGAVRNAIEKLPGVAQVMDGEALAAAGCRHERSGDLVVLAEEDAWFTYYYWEDETRAPDFARTVDIHRKPGYDPVELFVDPAIPFPKLRIGWRLLQKKLGMRMLMDVVPLDAGLVKGSHGVCPKDQGDWPLIGGHLDLPEPGAVVHSTDVFGLLKAAVEASP